MTSKKYELPTITDHSFRPYANGQETVSNPTGSAPIAMTTIRSGELINATAPEYTPSKEAGVSGSDLPPAYSEIAGRTNPFPGVDKYPAQLAITEQPVYDSAYPKTPAGKSGSSGDNWEPPPGSSGLELFKPFNELILHQQKYVPAVSRTRNIKQTVEDNMGQKVFTAIDSTDVHSDHLLPFLLDLRDHDQMTVLNLSRDSGYYSCCCPCCLQRVEVSSGGALIGVVEQKWTLCSPAYRVLDVSGHPVLRIEGNYGAVEFGELNIISSDGSSLGKIMKQKSTGSRDGNDYASVSFDVNLDVKLKATLMGAVFLIYSQYYRDKNYQNQSNDCECCGCCANVDSCKDCCTGNNGYKSDAVRDAEGIAYCCLCLCHICFAIAECAK